MLKNYCKGMITLLLRYKSLLMIHIKYLQVKFCDGLLEINLKIHQERKMVVRENR